MVLHSATAVFVLATIHAEKKGPSQRCPNTGHTSTNNRRDIVITCIGQQHRQRTSAKKAGRWTDHTTQIPFSKQDKAYGHRCRALPGRRNTRAWGLITPATQEPQRPWIGTARRGREARTERSRGSTRRRGSRTAGCCTFPEMCSTACQPFDSLSVGATADRVGWKTVSNKRWEAQPRERRPRRLLFSGHVRGRVPPLSVRDGRAFSVERHGGGGVCNARVHLPVHAASPYMDATSYVRSTGPVYDHGGCYSRFSLSSPRL